MNNELDLTAIEITNPTSESFTWQYNGQPYTLEAGESKAFARPVSYHLAKHLSTQMVVGEVKGSMTKKDQENPHAKVHVKVSQLTIYDTHERRVALYKILKDEQRVVEVITRYPFKGFIGDMEIYKAFVDKAKAAGSKKEGK